MTENLPFLVRLRTRAYWSWPRLAAVAIGLLLIGGFLFYPKGPAPKFVTVAVTRGSLVVTVSATGTLNPQNSVDVGVEVSGRVDSVLVDFNDPVQKGQTLAIINTDQTRAQLEQSEATLATNTATLIQAKQKLDRYLVLTKEGAVTKQDLQTAQGDYDRAIASIRTAKAQIATQRTNIAKAVVRSPIDGVVLNRNISTGQTVAASFQTPVLFTLASDLSKMQLQVDIDEADIGQVQMGQHADFQVDAFPQEHFDAQLVSLRNSPKTVNGVVSYTGVLVVDNKRRLLRPGMTATAEILTAREDNVLLVPNGALRFTPAQTALKAPIPPLPTPANGQLVGRIWILKAGVAEPRDLVLGRTDGKSTRVISGNVAAGEAAITDIVATVPAAGTP